MGCVNSKQKGCSNCNTPYCPVPRSYSMHVHHPPQSKGDSYHVVALTSTTLGSLDLNVTHNHVNGFRFSNVNKVSDMSDSFRKEKEEKEEKEKTWSNMIEHKLPKAIIAKKSTPIITTPPCEPETIINTWELMEGLEEDTTSPFQSPNVNANVHVDVDPTKPSFIENDHGTTTEEGSNLKVDQASDFDDPQVARKGLFCSEEKKISGDDDDVVVVDFKVVAPYGKEEVKVVLYFTSLRGVRKTYEDCCHVRLILKGYGVRVDERDVSMHLGFKEELKELLGGDGGYYGKGGILPRVFVGRKYIGGAEEIQKLHEDGKLEKLLDCCEKIDDDNDDGCEACGDIRFVPCETCYGSCKIYYEGDDDEEEYEGDGEVDECGFQRCPDCNENGLIRCPNCC